MLGLLGIIVYFLIALSSYALMRTFFKKDLDAVETALLSIILAFIVPLGLLIVLNHLFLLRTTDTVIVGISGAFVILAGAAVLFNKSHKGLKEKQNKTAYYEITGVLIAVAVFLFVVSPHFKQNTMWIDEALDENLAAHLVETGEYARVYEASGEVLPTRRHPFMPFSLATAYSFFGKGDDVLYGVNIFLGILGLMSIYLVGKRIFSPATGFFAMILASVSPLYAFYSLRYLTEMSQIVVTGIATYLFMLSLMEKRYVFLPLFAYVAAMLPITKLNLGVLLIAMFFVYLLSRRAKLKENVREIFRDRRNTFVSIGIFLVVFISYFAYSYHYAHDPFYAAKASLEGNRAESAQMPFIYFIQILPWFMGSAPAVLFFLAGIFMVFRTKDKEKRELLYLGAVALAITSFIFTYKEDRYFLFLYPLILPIVAYPLGRLVDLLIAKRDMKNILFGVVVGLVFVSAITTGMDNGKKVVESKIPSYQGLKSSGNDIRQLVPFGGSFFSTSGIEHGYYADRRAFFVARETSKFLEDFRRWNATVVALTVYEDQAVISALQKAANGPMENPANAYEYVLQGNGFVLKKIIYTGESPTVFIFQKE